MNFWETVLGNETASAICRSLPRIADAFEEGGKTRREQKVFLFNASYSCYRRSVSDLNDALTEGWCVANSFGISETEIMLILERFRREK